ncbi:MAG: PPC domain-containing DNA-binding protein [Candidatus Micrarchaeota archaeon]
MEYRRKGDAIAIRFDQGDELISSLKALCAKEKVSGALVSGIGAAKKAEIAHYDPDTKEYHVRKLEGKLEIVSLSGNVAMKDGEAVPHLHVAMSMRDFSTVSGHLMKAEIRPTCELVLLMHGIAIRREHDEETGLNLQRF